MPPLSPFNKTAITLALSQVITLPVQAATITVDTINDTLVAGTCSLRMHWLVVVQRLPMLILPSAPQQIKLVLFEVMLKTSSCLSSCKIKK